MFISNHCPYVKAIQTRLAEDCRELLTVGINTIAIQSNDVVNYPDDSFENMQMVARARNFSFPYVCGMKHKRWQKATVQFAPQIFLGLTLKASCNIAHFYIFYLVYNVYTNYNYYFLNMLNKAAYFFCQISIILCANTAGGITENVQSLCRCFR